ncbi:efflux RND transporter periplasmic adaptor subunit [Sphingomonas sp. LaA6.9]|uniref:efflux RND transporter periplasmic adaptor subunit n=1 Tax=Sphingomonas sp. LaA6.9 TaxID=2919914 RepID=UPI001F4FA1D9|nr:efflux RND transporter periplasmic adaptor subunit [Sphingomonas sp. LaA6.9]MCJ8158045.1 efflux RND transporter periplasmic adaptor subunit [Sphingomonas sp. LaA6.9]
MRRTTTLRNAASGALAATLLALAGCSGGEQPAPPPPAVDIITIRPQAIDNVIELPGRIQAVRTAEVRARVNGIVERRLYEEGTDVRAGQPLFQIDPRELRASLNAALATLSRNQATAANAQQDVQRYQGLITDQAISKQEYDAAVARLRTAQADVALARAQVESARLNLGYSTVTAPISGRAGRGQVTEGALVSAAGGTLFTTIEQLGTVYVNFSQSSSDVLAVRRDVSAGRLKMPSNGRLPVELILEDGSAYGLGGHIDFLDLAIDEATGTAAIRAEFPNPSRLLLPGQFVRARAKAGVRSDGLLVPQRAVKLTAQGATVMVVGDKNIATVRNIKLGNLQGSSWVIRDGLKAGDRVIVNGLQKVQPGSPVSISTPGAKPAPAKPAATR